MKQRAIIIYGPPGSGKGTQAELLTRRFPFIHFDTGRFIENLVYSPGATKDPIIRREKKLWETGILCTPSWVLKVVTDAVTRIAKAGYSVVFSGSPRTLFEAFGDKKYTGLVKVLEKLYGKKNVVVIKLDIHHTTSMKRNSQRFICSVCGLPIMAHSRQSHCSFCGAKMRTRKLDDPKVIPTRLKEYENRTFPILKELATQRFMIKHVDGEKLPYLIFKAVVKKLDLE
ncbi:MAG: nucleoside monophosphate kinase [Patescibacteria group bacterium]